MIARFKIHIATNFPNLEGKKLLLATSGGMDSMVMAHLFSNLNYEFALAHCNFQLRGGESSEDQKFVYDFANANKIPIFLSQFETLAFANENKYSIQVAARKLRYKWFNELLETQNYDYVLTAHHLDDSLETYLIHFIRGSGLNGFTGIPAQNDKVIRPLLAFSRDEILQYAELNTVKWREDSSNASDKYLRNKIRHEIVPILKELNPNFLNSFLNTQNYLKEAQTLVNDAAIMVYQQVALKINDDIHFNIEELLKHTNYKSYLHQWLKEFGFSAWDDIYELVNAQSGKQVVSGTFRLLKNRNFLILSAITNIDISTEYYINENQKDLNFPIKMSISDKNYSPNTDNSFIFVDADKLKYPLVLKKLTSGAKYFPIGMNGKSKKVSKFFKDEKLSLLQKENAWILYSDDKIVWIVGMRQDDRFKNTDNTTKSIQITLLQ